MQFPFPLSPAEAGDGQLISFMSLKPGAGASTLACLAAISLAATQHDTALIDLNPDSKVRSYMGFPADVSTASILDINGIGRPETIISAGEETHHKNLTVFPGAIQTLDARQITAALQQRACTALKQIYPWTVASLGALHSPSWSALILSDLIFLVITPSRTDMDAFRDQMEILARLGVSNRIVIVLNKLGYPGSLDDNDAKAYFIPDLVVNYDQKINEGSNKRELVPGSALKSRLLEAMFRTDQANRASGTGLLARFKRKVASV